MKTSMTRTLFFVLFFALGKQTKCQGVHTDDYNFNNFLMAHYPSCIDHIDGNLGVFWNTTCTEFQNEDSLNLDGVGISDYTPLSWFTSLTYLNVSHNTSLRQGGFLYLTTQIPPTIKKLICTGSGDGMFLPVKLQGILPASLEYLNVDSNYSTTFFSSMPPGLKYLKCSNNLMDSIGPFPATLDTLISAYCITADAGIVYGLGKISALPLNLKYLDLSNNKFSALPTLPSTLTHLDFSYNIQSSYSGNQTWYYGGLSALPAMPPLLEYFNSSGSILTPATGNTITLPALPSTLQYLSCYRNYLNGLPTLPTGLKYLDCTDNNISVLPVLPDSLVDISFGKNTGILSVPPLPGKLAYLDFSYTNVSCIPALPASMGGLSPYHPYPSWANFNFYNDTHLKCLPNSVNGMRLNGILPLCSPVNNSNHCYAFPVISGNIFYDNNSNGIKDPGENYRPNVSVELSNGLHAYSNNTGYYELSADLGNYTLNVNAPPYYAAVPANVNYSFSTYDTLVNEQIALQPTAAVDSMKITIVPLANMARPNFSYPYKIKYENVGTTTVSPVITVNYDHNNLTYNSSSNASVIDNGTYLSLTEGIFTPGQQGNFTANFTVKLNATLGDTVKAKAIITANSSIASDSTYSIVRGSYDPNDKQATPILTPLQVNDGVYINYLVRFQNTGNASAINVVVTDTLNSQLDANSFELINTSHDCKVSRNGNKVAFEFLNILLPSKNTDEPGSHGFIRFRVRALPGTPDNTVIPNNASIYFDYNVPVLTNTANTLIQLHPIPLNLLSFKALTSADNNVLLYWITNNEISTRSFTVEQSMDGRNFIAIGQVNANGRGNNRYDYQTFLNADIVYYRLKMTDMDGRYTYSQIIAVKRSKAAESIVILNNPVKQVLSIVTNDPLLANSNADIINSQGQLVKSFMITTGIQNIDVAQLAMGIYYLKTSVSTTKIVISR